MTPSGNLIYVFLEYHNERREAGPEKYLRNNEIKSSKFDENYKPTDQRCSPTLNVIDIKKYTKEI